MFPHHENERAQAVATDREFARHWMHNGWVEIGRGEDVQVAGQLHLPGRSAGAERRPLLPPAGAAVALPVAHRGDPGDHRRRRGRAGPAGRDGPPVRAGRPAGGGPGGRPDRARRPMPGRRSTPRPWPGSGTAWTTTSTPPGRWPPSSTWCAGPTLRPTPATPWAPPRAAAHRGAAALAALGAAVPDGRDRHRSGHRRARAASGRGPVVTRTGTQADTLRGQLEAAGWVVEDGPEGTRIRRQ